MTAVAEEVRTEQQQKKRNRLRVALLIAGLTLSPRRSHRNLYFRSLTDGYFDQHLGSVDPQHVRVEVYHGEAEDGGIKNPATTMLDQSSQNGDGSYIYRGSVPASESGAYGFSIRVVPTHPHLQQNHELRLITWS